MSIFEFLIETLHYKSKLYLTTGLTVLIGEAQFLFDNMISGNEDRLQSTMYKKCVFFKNSANCVFEYLKAEVLILIF